MDLYTVLQCHIHRILGFGLFWWIRSIMSQFSSTHLEKSSAGHPEEWNWWNHRKNATGHGGNIKWQMLQVRLYRLFMTILILFFLHRNAFFFFWFHELSGRNEKSLLQFCSGHVRFFAIAGVDSHSGFRTGLLKSTATRSSWSNICYRYFC